MRSSRAIVRRCCSGAAALTVLSLCGLAAGAGVVASSDEIVAVKELQMIYRGAQVQFDQGRPHVVAGAPMAGGVTPRASAEFWLSDHGAALGAAGSTLREAWSATFSNNAEFTVFCYQQYVGDLPVEHGIAKVLVRNGLNNPVVYAAGTLAPAPAAGFADLKVNGVTAVALVRAMTPYQAIPVWSKQPELVVFQGLGDWQEPVRAWKFVGESLNLADPLRKTFFVDAATGALVGVRDEVSYTDVNGSVKGWGSPGVRPDEAINPPLLLNMGEIKAGITGGNSAFADRNGNFTIVNGGSSPVTVKTGVSTAGGFGGRWINVVPNGATGITASTVVTPPGPANLVLNSSPGAATTAQVNALIAGTAIHDYFRDRSGSWNFIDLVLPANTGVAGTCNAFFNGSSINFFNAAGGCVNSAYSTVVAHEYGHFIVSKLGGAHTGLPQNAFGEGFGDTCAMLLYDVTAVGQDFEGVGTNVRDPVAANVQYPCNNEIHFCGQVLAGAWYNIRSNMGAAYGSASGLTRTQQLQVAWALITTGGPDSSNSAGPGTLAEVLTADDDDGNLGNGTPNIARICPAFQAHNITTAACTGGGPPNNTCANAAAITNGTTPFTTVGATTDGPTVACNAFSDPQVNQDVWYAYTATCTGTVTVSLCGSGFDTKLAVYDGAACPAAANSELACNDDSCNLQSQLSFGSVIGHQYRIRVGGYQTAAGSGNIVISVAPGNDDCANAFPIADGVTPYSTEGATTDGPMVGCNGFGDPQINQDVWYTYTAPISGTCTVSLCGSNFDGKLAVYDGAACPVTPMSDIACDDDACAFAGPPVLSFQCVQGHPYKIRAGGFLTAFGSGNITISTIPINDSCANALPIGNGSTAFSTAGATTDGPPVACNGFGDPQVNQDVWYTYTAACNGTVSVGACGSTFDTKIAVYDGAACPSAAGSEITCNDDSCGTQSQATFSGVQGHQYKIRVGGFLTAAGSGTITIACAGCYANCDNSTSPPVLNVNDFICFQNKFAAGNSYANCDGSTTQPVLNVNDFVCFQAKFAAGCP